MTIRHHTISSSAVQSRLKSIQRLSLSIVFSGFVGLGCTSSDQNQMTGGRMSRGRSKMMSAEGMAADKVIADWAERPRLGANEMIAKYGEPQEVTAQRLIWNNVGPFKRIAVMNLETPHDFPLPHVDYIEHTIEYDVPQDKVADLIAFDASSTINRTVGELSARCDLEGHNVLTLNLDHDIVTGKKSVEEARKDFGEIVGQDVSGKHPAYVEALQFTPAKPMTAQFSDTPVIPGSPVRPGESEAQLAGSRSNNSKMGDATILATVVAIDLNEVLAAAQAGTKKMSGPAAAYAKMLHEQHGAHMNETMKFGQQIGVTPLIDPSVEKLQKKGAGELSALVTLNGMEFERAYIAAMVKGHTEAVNMIDNQLLKSTSNALLKKHLTETRSHIADHLEKAKALQSSMRR